MATLVDRSSIVVRRTAARAEPVRRRRSLDELSDAEAGKLAVGVIGGVAALLGAILLAIALYAGTRGFALTVSF